MSKVHEKSIKVRFIEKQLEIAEVRLDNAEREAKNRPNDYIKGALIGRKETVEVLRHLLGNCSE